MCYKLCVLGARPRAKDRGGNQNERRLHETFGCRKASRPKSGSRQSVAHIEREDVGLHGGVADSPSRIHQKAMVCLFFFFRISKQLFLKTRIKTKVIFAAI